MAFVGEIAPVEQQYSAPIGPMPVTGEPMAASLVKGAIVGLPIAIVVSPPLGLLAAAGVVAVSRRKKGAAAGGW
jgi:hypothetical protein